VVQSWKNAQIMNVNSKLVLDLNQDPDNPVTQRESDPNKDSQRWDITVVEGDRCLIENVQNRNILAPNGEWELVFEPKGATGQQWTLATPPQGGDVYYIENPKSTDHHVLEVAGSSTQPGALVDQFQKNQPATANQQWELIGSPVPPVRPGSIRAWGYNGHGELGVGDTTDRHTPVAVKDLTTVTAIATGDNHTLALLADGSVQAWGSNDHGQLGDGTTIERHTPVAVTGLSNATAIAAGVESHCLALLADGSVQAWGWNYRGQLGDGTTIERHTPVAVTGLANVTAIAAGVEHSLALLEDGSVRAWGGNVYGQLGVGDTTDRHTPVAVKDLTTVKAIAAGQNHCLALLADGSVRAWGWNGFGQLGVGDTTERHTPVAVAGLANATAIAAGGSHCLALLADGSVRAWGWNLYGQLGVGDTTERHTPVAVTDLTTAIAIAIAIGAYHSLALLEDGSVRAWGNNGFGQLGVGDTTDRHTPVAVTDLTTVTAIAAGHQHSLAVV